MRTLPRFGWFFACLAAIGSGPASGCAETRYLLQAAPGQLELATRARSIGDVIADSQTDPRTRFLLNETQQIKAFANGNGLASKGNYEKYVDLDRSAVVYFLAASKPLAFIPKLWSFPLVGSFPYTGWFDYWQARATRKRLERDGWDVHVRMVRAYSTGGWLRDPLLSTMLTGGDGAIRYLANVIIHELTHSNFFVPDQATFNESLASFVGDQMADDYLVSRFGAESEEVLSYRAEHAASEARAKLLGSAYSDLETLYASDKSDAEKRTAKKARFRQLRIDADLSFQPNNAGLVGFKTYNTGIAEFNELWATTCERDWSRFFKVIRALKKKSFPSPQDEEIGAFVTKLSQAGCP